MSSKIYSHQLIFRRNTCVKSHKTYMDRVKRIWYLSPMRAAKVQASLRIRTVSPEPSLLAHKSNESRGTFRQKARSLAPLNGWACAVKICHDGMLEDTNSLDGAHISLIPGLVYSICIQDPKIPAVVSFSRIYFLSNSMLVNDSFTMSMLI